MLETLAAATLSGARSMHRVAHSLAPNVRMLLSICSMLNAAVTGGSCLVFAGAMPTVSNDLKKVRWHPSYRITVWRTRRIGLPIHGNGTTFTRPAAHAKALATSSGRLTAKQGVILRQAEVGQLWRANESASRHSTQSSLAAARSYNSVHEGLGGSRTDCRYAT